MCLWFNISNKYSSNKWNIYNFWFFFSWCHKRKRRKRWVHCWSNSSWETFAEMTECCRHRRKNNKKKTWIWVETSTSSRRKLAILQNDPAFSTVIFFSGQFWIQNVLILYLNTVPYTVKFNKNWKPFINILQKCCFLFYTVYIY